AVLKASLPGLCLVGDSCLPTYYAVWQYEAPLPRRYFHSATGAGTLGYAIPAALGARHALPPDVPVVALIGDGAAQFTLMELGAAVQEGLAVIVLVWNNAGYREIKAGMIAADVEPVGVDITPPDFVAAARALGCAATRLSSRDELPEALTDAASRAVPTLLELPEHVFVSGPVGTWYD
ncbi:MAG: thiamine pyrophosphate-dependent enzyme, partial [Pseudomonadota bacterium]